MAASNSRLTAVGRQATASDTIHRPVSRLFFSLPTFDEKTTELHLHAEKLTETIAFELGTLCGFFFLFFLVLCGFVLFYVTPLMRQLQNNI
jgi:hypothetical protein